MPMEELDHSVEPRREVKRYVRCGITKFLSDMLEIWLRLAVWLGDVIEDGVALYSVLFSNV